MIRSLWLSYLDLGKVVGLAKSVESAAGHRKDLAI
jgi:hypothetical protein